MGARASHPRSSTNNVRINGMLFINDTHFSNYHSKDSLRISAKRFVTTAQYNKESIAYIATFENRKWIFKPIANPQNDIYENTKQTYLMK